MGIALGAWATSTACEGSGLSDETNSLDSGVRATSPARPGQDDIRIFSGNANPDLAADIAKHLGTVSKLHGHITHITLLGSNAFIRLVCSFPVVGETATLIDFCEPRVDRVV